MSGSETYTVRRLDEMERAFGGAIARVRAELGISAFGVQVADLPPNSGELAPEHDHLHDGQEELYLLLAGSAEVVLPDGVALDSETFIRIGPAVRRRVRSGPSGARLLMIGGFPGQAYVAPASFELGGPETLACPTASTAIAPDGPPPQLRH
jgi:hypothetical protein